VRQRAERLAGAPLWQPCLAALVLALCGIGAARSQQLTPRAYVIAPVGTNAAVLEVSHLQGELQLDSALISGATTTATLPSVGYYRTFDLLGRTASLTLGLPYAFGKFQGTAVGVPHSFERSGRLDASLRLSVNLIGGPAMQAQEFARWRQRMLLGLSLKVIAPSGQYDSTRLVNWGANRWGFKPELGYSQRWGHWLLDTYVGGWFYTTNPEYFSRNAFYPGVRDQSESPIGSFEGHISYDVIQRLWISFDANYWWGGRTALNGISNPRTEQKSSRVGLTASVPFTVHQSLKLSFSQGAYVRYGGNYRSVSLAWQYSWFDAPSSH